MNDYKVLHLSRQGAFWRMDDEHALLFISMVCLYFRKDEELGNLNYDKLNYLELDYQELCKNYMIFGTYFASPEKLWLVVVPGYLHSIYEDSLKMRLCVNQSGKEHIIDVCIRP